MQVQTRRAHWAGGWGGKGGKGTERKAVHIPVVMQPDSAICACSDRQVTVGTGGQAYNGSRVKAEQLLHARFFQGATVG